VTRIQFLLLWMGIASGAAFVAHVIDKRAAVRQGRRVPEGTLHLLALLGGWPGAVLAMGLVRHKTRKASFLAVTAGILVLHALLGYAAWREGWLAG
jgi:uncharacterized membrane protein YsdA (DUF1294 family)